MSSTLQPLDWTLVVTSSYRRWLIASVIAVVAFCDARKAVLAAVTFSGDATTAVGGQAQIGGSGFGTLRIDGGSSYAPSSAIIGVTSSAVGLATVTGAGSQWTLTSGSMDVGSNGFGRLDILSGGYVSNLALASAVRIAVYPTSQGTLVVDGAGSSLYSWGSLSLGETLTSGGSALLQISNSAVVNARSSTTIWTGGRVELSGGTLRTNGLATNGVIAGSGELYDTSSDAITNDGRIEANSGNDLKISGAMDGVQNDGVISGNGATLEFQGAITNSSNGNAEITLRNSLMRAGTLVTSGPQLTNAGVLAATGGLNDFYGRITNSTPGSVAVTNNSTIVFHDSLTADGGTVTVFPGSSAVFLKDLTVAPACCSPIWPAPATAVTAKSRSSAMRISSAHSKSPWPAASRRRPAARFRSSQRAASRHFITWRHAGPSSSTRLGPGRQRAPGRAERGSRIGRRLQCQRHGGRRRLRVMWQRAIGQSGHGLIADGNDDDKVDDADYGVWQANFRGDAPWRRCCSRNGGHRFRPGAEFRRVAVDRGDWCAQPQAAAGRGCSIKSSRCMSLQPAWISMSKFIASWSPAGPAFWARICASGWSTQGHDVICLDNFFTSQKTNVAHLLDRPNFELVRHDVTQPIFLEVDEIYNLACPAAPGHYQYNPIKTMKTSVHGRDQHAGHGQALPGQDPAGLDQRSLRRPRGPSAARELSRQRQPDRPAGLLRRRQAGGRDAVHGLPPHEQASTSASCGSSTPTARGCTRSTAAWCRTSSARRCAARTSRSSATAARPARSAIATIWSRA